MIKKKRTFEETGMIVENKNNDNDESNGSDNKKYKPKHKDNITIKLTKAAEKPSGLQQPSLGTGQGTYINIKIKF